MIGHDDIGCLELTSGLPVKTMLEVLTFATAAITMLTHHRIPGIMTRHKIQIAQGTVFGHLCPGGNPHQIRQSVVKEPLGTPQSIVHTTQTQIIVSPFGQTRGKRMLQHFTEKRDIFINQLLLKSDRIRADQHLFLALDLIDSRQKIGKALSRSGSRLDAQMTPFFKGLLAAGLALGASWILISVFFFMIAPAQKLRSSIESKRKHHQLEKEKKQQQQIQEERRRREQETWERNAPIRERQRKLQIEAEQKKKTEQLQLEEVRLDSLIWYDQNAHQLQDLFPRERFLEYLDQHLGSNRPVEVVKQRGEQFKKMIDSILEKAGGNKQKFSSLIEISSYFHDQREEILSLNYDDLTKQSLITSLNDQEDRAIRNFLSS